MKLYNIHLKFSDDSEIKVKRAAESLPKAFTELSDDELENLHSIKFITEFKNYEDCMNDLDGEVNMLFLQIADLANAADLLRDGGLSGKLSGNSHDCQMSEYLSVMVEVIESKVHKVKEYLEIMDSVIRRRVDIPKNEREPFNATQ